MLSGIISAVFGLMQALMLKTALFSFTAGNYTRAALFVLVKLMLYGVGAVLAVFVFSDALINLLVGYTVGLLASAIALFVRYGVSARTVNTEGDTDEIGNNN